MKMPAARDIETGFEVYHRCCNGEARDIGGPFVFQGAKSCLLPRKEFTRDHS
jgi:hypothetical protein